MPWRPDRDGARTSGGPAPPSSRGSWRRQRGGPGPPSPRRRCPDPAGAGGLPPLPSEGRIGSSPPTRASSPGSWPEGPRGRVPRRRGPGRRRAGRATCLLKGAPSVVATPRWRPLVPGQRQRFVRLRPGGMGDVLTGVAGALLARGCRPRTAAALALHLTGRAADHEDRGAGALSFPPSWSRGSPASWPSWTGRRGRSRAHRRVARPGREAPARTRWGSRRILLDLAAPDDRHPRRGGGRAGARAEFDRIRGFLQRASGRPGGPGGPRGRRGRPRRRHRPLQRPLGGGGPLPAGLDGSPVEAGFRATAAALSDLAAMAARPVGILASVAVPAPGTLAGPHGRVSGRPRRVRGHPSWGATSPAPPVRPVVDVVVVGRTLPPCSGAGPGPATNSGSPGRSAPPPPPWRPGHRADPRPRARRAFAAPGPRLGEARWLL
jgi:hypothetical protein